MSLPELLSTLTQSLISALDALPSPTALAAPSDGLSLLSTKNELLLSYLQNLTFLIVLKLRALAADPAPPGPTTSSTTDTNTADTAETTDTADAAADPTYDAVVQTLVALGVYMEKGVRPLESRLAYQVDKLLLAASSASVSGSKPPDTSLPSGARSSKSPLSSRSPSPSSPKIPPLAHRPNPTSLLPPPSSSSSQARHYRPPHITPTAPPTASRLPAARSQRTQRKSAALEEFVREEMGDAPVAEMSTGAGSGARGKAAKRESERRAYEEGRLVRLPEVKRRRISAQGGEWGGLGLDEDGDGDGDGGRGEKRRRGRKGR